MTRFTKQNLVGAKLTAEMVLWGRAQYDLRIRTNGRQGMNMRQIADVQSVSRETVARYLRGETWKSITQDLPDSFQEEKDRMLQKAAEYMAPSNESAEIQASLAKLASLGVQVNSTNDEEKEDGTDTDQKAG